MWEGWCLRLFHCTQTSKSFNTALHQLTHKLESTLKNGEVALGCCMDIEDAFDNTEFNVITDATRETQMESIAVKWIIKMLSSRTVEAVVCGTKSSAVVTRGCPQGGILSRILWCMVIDSLLVKLWLLHSRSLRRRFYARGFSVSVIGDLMRCNSSNCTYHFELS